MLPRGGVTREAPRWPSARMWHCWPRARMNWSRRSKGIAMAHNGDKVRLGVDIGGTFTDVAMEIGASLHSTKVLTNYAEPEQAILEAIERVAENADIPLAAIDTIIHGTTLATNALIERRGAKTALLTSAGFRDVIEMRTESRFEQYDLNLVLPPPLIARDSRYPVGVRISASGRE